MVYVDLTIVVDKETHSFYSKTFMKPSNSFQYVDYPIHHPQAMKITITKGEVLQYNAANYSTCDFLSLKQQLIDIFLVGTIFSPSSIQHLNKENHTRTFCPTL